ncbi:HNH endonuclease [Halotia branconii]|uniref:HNH endonuclease n=1 Tax=Halotia branconii CENA392 TaxID=1539056 RepID=A0AAJ6NSY7_9CYAN|nr:HNH endonuclease [Halotia branconii]WGV26032.1 HNH endonuclease [Halotia branconii CENA392]
MSKAKQPANQRSLVYYCECFSNIKVYKSQTKGDALNKPILLLSIIDLITQYLITDNRITMSNELIDTFKKYWEVLASSTCKGSDFALPFFHLKNDNGKFWHLKYSSGYDGGRPQTIPKLKEDVDYAYLDDELFDLIQDEISRQILIDALVSAWLPSEDNTIEKFLTINENFQDITLKLDKNIKSSNLDVNHRQSLRKSVIRNAFFRKAIVSIYGYKCAFCGLKVTKKINQNIVDGAHIKPFSQFYDSKINNGIALCKNHHWAFDRGWFAVDEQYKIIVSHDLEEVSPNAKPMKDFHGETILLPNTEQYFPELEALQWHRENIFKSR